MALVLNDRVKQTSATTGTGTYDLDAGIPAGGFQGFVAGIGDGKTCYYCATDGVDYEIGVGTVTDAATDTLARTLILESSNADAAVGWGAGSKTIFCTMPGKMLGPRVRLVTAAGAVTVGPTDLVIVVKKTVGAATAVNFPTVADRLAQGGWPITVKDGKGDADTNNITPTFNGAETADGLAGSSFVIDNKYGRRTFIPNPDGSEWLEV